MDQRLCNLRGILDPGTTCMELRASLMPAIVYAAGAPLQELIARGCGRQRCLVGRATRARPIVASDPLLASAHLHLSVSCAIVVFFPELLWAGMVARRPNVAGVGV